MKIPKTVKMVSKSELKKKADTLALDYFDKEAKEAEAASAKTEIKERIKAFAKQKGKLESKSTLVRGFKYAVGFTSVDPSPKLNIEKALKVLPPGLKLKCAKSVMTIDESEFYKLVGEGKISRELLEKCCDHRQGFDRILVTTIAKLEEYFSKTVDSKGE